MTAARSDLMALDREAFIAAHKHLDLTEDKDGWGRPKFAHDMVQALWDGWHKSRSALRLAASQPDRDAVKEFIASASFASRSSLDSDTIFCEIYTPGYQPAKKGSFGFFVKELRAILSLLSGAGTKSDGGVEADTRANETAKALMAHPSPMGSRSCDEKTIACGVAGVAPGPSDPSPGPAPIADSSEAGTGGIVAVTQPFEKYPQLAAHIVRLANTPTAFSLNEWNDFLAALNAALSAPVGEPGQSFVLRPISTAPRDGTPFIAIATTKGWRATKIARFLHAEDRLPIPDGGGMWPSPPTHWTQLPVVTLIPESDESPSCADSGDLIAPPAKIPGSSDNHPPAPAVGTVAPYILGNKYRTQAGDYVTFLTVAHEGSSYECMADEYGVHRYTRRDFGRVTGTAHDYSDPRNCPPLYINPQQPAPAVGAEDVARIKEALINARSSLKAFGGDPRPQIARYGEGDEIQAAVLNQVDEALSLLSGQGGGK